MNPDILFFFEPHPEALPLYEALEQRISAAIESVEIKVQKTQISFYNRRLFACASFLPIRKKADRPETWLTVTFGLDCPIHSPRIDVVAQVQPNRWTHHVLVGCSAEIDDELMDWIGEAAKLSAAKR